MNPDPNNPSENSSPAQQSVDTTHPLDPLNTPPPTDPSTPGLSTYQPFADATPPVPQPTTPPFQNAPIQPPNFPQPETPSPTPPPEPPVVSVAEPAPTDLSHLAAINTETPPANSSPTPASTPTPQPQADSGTLFTPSQFVPPIQLNSAADEKGAKDKKINLVLLIGLPVVALIVLAVSIFFFFNQPSQSSTAPASIPAQKR